MLISLPIQINGKSTNNLFNIHITDTTITITPSEISPINNIIVTSKHYGINTILIYFPFVLTIHKLWLINDLFFLLNTTSSLNNDDFISLLLETIIVTSKKSYKLVFNNL